MNENGSKIKRRRVKSINDELNNFSPFWSVKIFKTKKNLDDYIKFKNYKYRSSEEKTEKQRCRFCLALNPNGSQHMIQVYLNCKECVKGNLNCSKTNVCEIQKKYELLTKHKDISPEEWIIFDKDIVLNDKNNQSYSGILKLENVEKNSVNDDILIDKFLNLNINSKIQNEYYNDGEFYIWAVKDVLPSQKYLFKEVYIIKIKNDWIEFRNGEKKKVFRHITSNTDEIILREENGSIFKLNSENFYNVEDNEIEYEGEWVNDSNLQCPCIECSSSINKMVFQCDIHKNEYSNQFYKTVWKANIKYDIKYFKRKDFLTWEEYCNDEITNTFKFIRFDKNSDLVIQRISDEDPDYLRFTDRELFIGSVKDYIYFPLYIGSWYKEHDYFEKFRSIEQPKSSENQLKNRHALNDMEIEEYLKLVRKYSAENHLQVQGLEDPVILKYADSENINKYKEFVRVLNIQKKHYVLCTGRLDSDSDVCIFDIFHRDQIEENLAAQIKKWFSKETINIYIAKTRKHDKDLSGYYSLAWLTAYVMNDGKISVSEMEKLVFDESKFFNQYSGCIQRQEISFFPTIINTDANILEDWNQFESASDSLDQFYNILSENTEYLS